jgi:hypothetical protein
LEKVEVVFNLDAAQLRQQVSQIAILILLETSSLFGCMQFDASFKSYIYNLFISIYNFQQSTFDMVVLITAVNSAKIYISSTNIRQQNTAQQHMLHLNKPKEGATNL